MELTDNQARLIQMRETRQKRLRELGPVMAGSLVRRKDQSGYYLTDKVHGKTRTAHVSEQMYEQAKEWNSNHREAKLLLEELSEIQRALLKIESRMTR